MGGKSQEEKIDDILSALGLPDFAYDKVAGLAWLRFDDLRGVSFPLFAAEDISIASADALQERVDTIVIGLDRTLRKGYLKAVTGLLGGGAILCAILHHTDGRVWNNIAQEWQIFNAALWADYAV